MSASPLPTLSSPNLPCITLRHGAQRVDILDPRADARTLGARYVHGAYISAWRVGDRCLTTGPTRHWAPFGGRGLPETFELPLAWAMAGEHESFMRIGAGQLRRRGLNASEDWTRAALTATVDWTVTGQSESHITMTSGDGVETADLHISYEIERTVRVLADGLESRTTLALRCPRLRQHPISWFAHPFFAQSVLGATALEVPGAPEPVHNTRPANGFAPGPTGLARDHEGRWRFGDGVSRGVLGGLWGTSPELLVHLDPAFGGGRVGISVDRPLDHLVVWASDHVFSPEPKFCRLWLDGERASWGVRYRFLP